MSSEEPFETEHQPAYVYTSLDANADAIARPSKRRKLARQNAAVPSVPEQVQSFKFDPSLKELEASDSVRLRQDLFEQSWSVTKAQIQSVIDETNEDTLTEVTAFVNNPKDAGANEKLQAGFIVTGPNIASQEILFKQLSTRLKSQINGPVFILRSGDATNLKAILKEIIRKATNQKQDLDGDEAMILEQDGRKLLNYDLEILHEFVKLHGSQRVVVAFQDSEAFDTSLVAELVILFNSWKDRIPFVLLFGIATSVDFFHERVSRNASGCLSGIQFDVEQTSSVLERIFQRAVAGSKAPLRLGAGLVSSLMERQHDHVQSVQSFTAGLKYAYMCHFYGNPLSLLVGLESNADLLQSEHYQAIRILPSFKAMVSSTMNARKLSHARGLLEDDRVLLEELRYSLLSKDKTIAHILQSIHLLATCSPEPFEKIELYMKAFEGALDDSDFIQRSLAPVKRMAPDSLLAFLEKVKGSIENGCPQMDLLCWADDAVDLLNELADIGKQVDVLVEESTKTGKPVRSSYAIHSKNLRTTVIAQRVQLSFEKSTLSKQDEEYTALVDRLVQSLRDYLNCENPRDLFLHEAWLYDSPRPYRDVFAPRPRAAIERALISPHDYLDCQCCKGDASTQPTTAILYQWYLEAGSLINIADLWRAFIDNQTSDDEEVDEREALVLFYRALADLKLLGMVKQSRRKTDHLAKVSWNGL